MSISLFSDAYTNKPADQLLDIRFVGAIAGCYSLSSRAGSGDDVVQVFACRVQSISTRGAVLSAAVAGDPGERVSAKFEDFPVLSGTVSRVFDGGFAMDFSVTDQERAELAAKIDWIKKNRFRAQRDKRRHKRIMPPNPQSAIKLQDGSVMECFVIDVSRAGVAVSADILPPLGTRLAVGRAVGTVARHLDAGFAVTLDELVDLSNLEPIFQWSLSYVEKPADDAPKSETDDA